MVADQELVTVFIPDNPAELALVEATLRERGIPYAAKNSELQNLYGAGEIGAYSPAVESVAIQVTAGNLERSRTLIAEALGETAPPASGPDDRASVEEPSVEEQLARYSRYSLVWSFFFWIGGISSVLAVYFGIKAISLGRQAPELSTRKAWLGLAIGVIGVAYAIYYWGTYLL